jgi:hypothetical protein
LNVDRRWAAGNEGTIRKFMRAFVRAHQWFFANRDGSTSVAMRETGVSREYALRAWDEYTTDQIFPRDGDASTAAVQALIEISSLIRAVPNRVKSSADGYINRNFIRAACQELSGRSEARAS